MADVTEADREKAARVLFDVEMWAHVTGQRNVIAAALAEEREKARAPFLALADTLDGEAQRRWVRVLQARESGGRDTEFGERGAGDALHDAALRIRRAAEEG